MIGLFAFFNLLVGASRANGPVVATPTPLPPPEQGVVRFAVIGDYGSGSQGEAGVAALVQSWNPDFVLTLGDNNYPDGAAATIDRHIGKYYHAFIHPYTGGYGPGASENRFFPALGNHDWRSLSCQGDQCTGPYFDYFQLPGNERYYVLDKGPVRIYVLDSDPHEPDGRDASSTQASWLRSELAASTAPWNLIAMHHTIFSSSLHGSEPTLQWPYKTWGADAALSGHDHTYERIEQDGFTYFVNGLGGASIRGFNAPVEGSLVRYNGDYGAMLVEASAQALTFRFIARDGQVIDVYRMVQPTPTATPTYTATSTPTPTITSTPTPTPPSTAPAPTPSAHHLYLPQIEQ